MAETAKYAVVRLDAPASRGERLNVGLLVFQDSGLDIRLGRRLDKVKAISASLDIDILRQNIMELQHIDESFRADGHSSARIRYQYVCGLGLASLSSLSSFEYTSPYVYEDTIARLLESLVEPEPAIVRVKPKRSRLLSVIKMALKKERILGQPGDDLDYHQVIPEVKLAEGLVADFILKNGAMHVIETIDASSDDAPRLKTMKDIGLSALTLEQARIVFNNQKTNGRLVYDASPSVETLISPALKAIEHQGAELINWRSADDRLRFLVRLSELATPSIPQRARSAHRFVASNQSRLKLN